MKELENSTLELLHRRRINPGIQAYVLLVLVLLSLCSLPLIKVDVVSNSRGMVRSLSEPASLISPMTGIVERTVLKDNLEVNAGDTLVWIQSMETIRRMASYEKLIAGNRIRIRDLGSILGGKSSLLSEEYRQSLNLHLTSLENLELQLDLYRREFKAMESLFRDQLVPRLDYEEALSKYRQAELRADELRQQYKEGLSSELVRLEKENTMYAMEVLRLRNSLKSHFLLAPVTGSLMNCPGVQAGSVISAGMELASISNGNMLVAECFIETRDLEEIYPGLPVRITFDKKGGGAARMLETAVSQVDPDVTLFNGRPYLRVRCILDDPGNVRQGMTFYASMLLYKRSLAALMIDKGTWKLNPFLCHETGE